MEGTCYCPYLDHSWFISNVRNHMVIDTASKKDTKYVFWSPMIDKCNATNWKRKDK